MERVSENLLSHTNSYSFSVFFISHKALVMSEWLHGCDGYIGLAVIQGRGFNVWRESSGHTIIQLLFPLADVEVAKH